MVEDLHPGPSLRDSLAVSWGGKSYYERLESMVDASPAARPSARPSLASASPLTRAAAAAEALDDECMMRGGNAPLAACDAPAPTVLFAPWVALLPPPVQPAAPAAPAAPATLPSAREEALSAEVARLKCALATEKTASCELQQRLATQTRDAEAAVAELRRSLQAAQHGAASSSARLAAVQKEVAALSKAAMLSADTLNRRLLAAVGDAVQ